LGRKENRPKYTSCSSPQIEPLLLLLRLSQEDENNEAISTKYNPVFSSSQAEENSNISSPPPLVDFGDVVSRKSKPVSVTRTDDSFINGQSTTTTTAFSFGDVVSIKRPPPPQQQQTDATESTDNNIINDNIFTSPTSPIDCAVEERAVAAKMRKRNILVAILSVVLALSNFGWQLLHPVQPIQLLYEMQLRSVPMSVIGKNGKPTVVDFWAPWCQDCKLSAPALYALEQEYGNVINFISINGDQDEAWPYVEAFGVDAIPHMALIRPDGTVETALIGKVPKSIIQADFDALVKKQPTLPYTMLDTFAGKPPEQRRVHFEDERK
jgi:thiol-disulfide isomerase/thioredoxin